MAPAWNKWRFKCHWKRIHPKCSALRENTFIAGQRCCETYDALVNCHISSLWRHWLNKAGKTEDILLEVLYPSVLWRIKSAPGVSCKTRCWNTCIFLSLGLTWAVLRSLWKFIKATKVMNPKQLISINMLTHVQTLLFICNINEIWLMELTLNESYEFKDWEVFSFWKFM